MNAEFLVASLWAVVVVYWFWSRRGSGGDSIGSFRHELHVLENAAPVRMTAAHRLCPQNEALSELGAVVSQPAVGHEAPRAPVPRPPARSPNKRAEVRRRRLEVLVVLAALVFITLVTAVIVMSPVFLGLQLVADCALGTYVSLLLRAKNGALPMVRATPVVREATPVVRQGPVVRSAPVMPAPPVPVQKAIELDGYRGEHLAPANKVARLRRLSVYQDEGEAEPYGDFASYASLALAHAN